MFTVLTSFFPVKMSRPYCASELLDLEQEVYSKYRVGDFTAVHIPCQHCYRVKKGGRKEEYIRLIGETKTTMDDQTCSVCYRLRTIPNSIVPQLPSNATSIDDVKQIAKFYSWLYCQGY